MMAKMVSSLLPAALMLIASTHMSAAVPAKSSIVATLFADSQCRELSTDVNSPAFTCAEEVCIQYPSLGSAGCCEAEGCSWYPDCVPYALFQGHCQDSGCGRERTAICRDPSRPLCQPAAFSFRSEHATGNKLFACASDSSPSSLAIPFAASNIKATASQKVIKRKPDAKQIQQLETHLLGKRSSGPTIGGTVVGVIFCIVFLALLISCCARRNRTVATANASAVNTNTNTNNNGTNVYVMSPQGTGYGMQPMSPNGQAFPAQPQTVYIQGPPPPGAQVVYLSPAATPAPGQPGPQPLSEPPPSYHK